MKADTKDEKIDYNLCGELYQKLFNSLEVGFALCELILDQQGNPINYRFLKINSAFEIVSLEAQSKLLETRLKLLMSVFCVIEIFDS